MPDADFNQEEKMKKYFLLFNIVCLFFWGGCRKSDINGSPNFESLNMGFTVPDGGGLSYSVFTLTDSGGKKLPELNTLINDLLYDGLSARAYFDREKRLKQDELQYYVETVKDVWAIRGNLLSIKRTIIDDYSPGGGNTSSGADLFIINIGTAELLTVEDIIKTDDEHLKMLLKSLFPRRDENEVISNYRIFFNDDGIGFLWHISKHPDEIVLPYWVISDYLTSFGKMELIIGPYYADWR